MTIEIKKPVTKEKVQQAIEQLNNDFGKKNLKKHFGKLKKNLDGLHYQKQVRNEFSYQQIKIKMPDAIVAATLKYLQSLL